MNNRGLRKAQEAIYKNMVTAVIRSLTPFYGAKMSDQVRKGMAQATFATVSGARSLAQTNAYRDYVEFVGGVDPVPKLDMLRFNETAWQGTIDRLAEGEEIVNEDLALEVGMSSDNWARDAEWGQRYDSAKNDSRIGRVARVDFEPPTCPFCTLLNSRGAVYLSAETAAQTLHNGDTCELIFVTNSSQDYPGKANSEQALDRYKDAVKAAGPNANTSSILKALAEQHPDRPTGRVKANAESAAKASQVSAVTDARNRVRALENTNPSSASAKAYRDAQISRNQEILTALETESP